MQAAATGRLGRPTTRPPGATIHPPPTYQLVRAQPHHQLTQGNVVGTVWKGRKGTIQKETTATAGGSHELARGRALGRAGKNRPSLVDQTERRKTGVSPFLHSIVSSVTAGARLGGWGGEKEVWRVGMPQTTHRALAAGDRDILRFRTTPDRSSFETCGSGAHPGEKGSPASLSAWQAAEVVASGR
jgi:hypothetical protein